MNRIKYLLILLTIPLFLSSAYLHEYYVSVTNIEYVKEEKSVQIITQIFIDDFETLIRDRFDDRITLDTENESLLVEDYMQRYLSDKLIIKLNGKPVEFNFIGKEYKDDITYCYLEIENIIEVNSIEVKNRVLFDVFMDQQNIIRLKINNKNKSFLLIPDNDNCLLNFN
ncbi:DUF6702 family protein [Winogradskyella sp. A2]|uniref:DUF6702 family protein n=1 Tax=Winogradskyella sp. A2 TaxID=3366944 RepID=UPI00398C4B0A